MVYHVYDLDYDVVGIGKVIFATPDYPWNIPTLHFLVTAVGDHFEASNLELALVSGGKSPEEAAEHLVRLIIAHISVVMQRGRGFDELKETALRDGLAEFWAVYRHIEFSLAERKMDLGHKAEAGLTSAIRGLLDTSDKETAAFKVESVSYMSLEAVAA